MTATCSAASLSGLPSDLRQALNFRTMSGRVQWSRQRVCIVVLISRNGARHPGAFCSLAGSRGSGSRRSESAARCVVARAGAGRTGCRGLANDRVGDGWRFDGCCLPRDRADTTRARRSSQPVAECRLQHAAWIPDRTARAGSVSARPGPGQPATTRCARADRRSRGSRRRTADRRRRDRHRGSPFLHPPRLPADRGLLETGDEGRDRSRRAPMSSCPVLDLAALCIRTKAG